MPEPELVKQAREMIGSWGSLKPPKEPIDIEDADAGIRGALGILRAAGVHTFESCEGSPGHSYLEPTIRFHGDHSEGYRALAVVLEWALPVNDLRRVWTTDHRSKEVQGPHWELTFRPEEGSPPDAR